MHVLFLIQGSTHLIDVQRYFAGKPQGLSPNLRQFTPCPQFTA